MAKASIPKGTRDFLPAQSLKRRYIFNIIEEVFLCYGFRPIETPALENLSTLTGKYGEEGDRLLFKVLNNGDFLKKADPDALAHMDSRQIVPSIAKRGLRYDLTVPFARFVSMYQNDLAFPFKRYQIQPVWRADRPQKGRYQEFFQCDVDVVGSSSLLYEAELIHIYNDVFARLRLPVEIRVNHRRVLSAIAHKVGATDKMMDMTMAVDKLDKIGWEKVKIELVERGLSGLQADKVEYLFSLSWENLRGEIGASEDGKKAIDEINTVLELADINTLENDVVLDTTLARGLNYYTGFIFEVKAKNSDMGSIGGGGRYDDLTGVFGLQDMSGVGISFGAERIYDVLEEKDLFPTALNTEVDLLFCPLDEVSLKTCFVWARTLRSEGVRCDVYPEPAKMKKQLRHADQRGLKWVAIMGSQEVDRQIVLLKDMTAGIQKEVTLDVLKGELP